MKKILGWLTSNVLLAFMYFAVTLSIIMLVLYFVVFHKGFSNNDDSWANFGSYFASITGLLAFAGVLYSIKISNENNKASEERGIFFKMLELYQKQTDLVICNDKNGVEAFKEYAIKANKYLVIYIALNELIKNNSYKKPFVAQYIEPFYEAVNSFWCQLSTEDECYEEDFDDFIIRIQNEKKLDYLIDYYNEAQRCSNIIMESIIAEEIYLAMRCVADLLYDKYGHLFGQYYRNIYYLMDMISKSEEENKYSKIFRAQLSRYELLLLLYNAVSTQSSIDTVKYLIKYDIFNNIVSDDIIMFNKIYCVLYCEPESLSRKLLRGFVNEILVEYQKDYKNIEYSWQP